MKAWCWNGRKSRKKVFLESCCHAPAHKIHAFLCSAPGQSIAQCLDALGLSVSECLFFFSLPVFNFNSPMTTTNECLLFFQNEATLATFHLNNVFIIFSFLHSACSAACSCLQADKRCNVLKKLIAALFGWSILLTIFSVLCAVVQSCSVCFSTPARHKHWKHCPGAQTGAEATMLGEFLFPMMSNEWPFDALCDFWHQPKTSKKMAPLIEWGVPKEWGSFF